MASLEHSRDLLVDLFVNLEFNWLVVSELMVLPIFLNLVDLQEGRGGCKERCLSFQRSLSPECRFLVAINCALKCYSGRKLSGALSVAKIDGEPLRIDGERIREARRRFSGRNGGRKSIDYRISRTCPARLRYGYCFALFYFWVRALVSFFAVRFGKGGKEEARQGKERSVRRLIRGGRIRVTNRRGARNHSARSLSYSRLHLPSLPSSLDNQFPTLFTRALLPEVRRGEPRLYSQCVQSFRFSPLLSLSLPFLSLPFRTSPALFLSLSFPIFFFLSSCLPARSFSSSFSLPLTPSFSLAPAIKEHTWKVEVELFDPRFSLSQLLYSSVVFSYFLVAFCSPFFSPPMHTFSSFFQPPRTYMWICMGLCSLVCVLWPLFVRRSPLAAILDFFTPSPGSNICTLPISILAHLFDFIFRQNVNFFSIIFVTHDNFINFILFQFSTLRNIIQAKTWIFINQKNHYILEKSSLDSLHFLSLPKLMFWQLSLDAFAYVVVVFFFFFVFIDSTHTHFSLDGVPIYREIHFFSSLVSLSSQSEWVVMAPSRRNEQEDRRQISLTRLVS